MTYELVDAGNANFPLGPSGMATGDIDGDGDVDVVATGQHGYAALTNDGDGGFALAFPGNSGTAMGSPSLVDVDGDRDLDMVGIVGGGGTSLPAVPFVQRNDGSGAFGDIEADPSAQPPGELDALVPADVDHDGDTDLLGAFVGRQQRRVGVFANDGTGAFADPVAYPLGFTSDTVTPLRLVAGDLDGDGDTDVVGVDARDVEQPDGTTVGRTFAMVALNDGHGVYAAAGAPIDVDFRPGTPFAQTPALVDLDGDHHLDLAIGGTGSITTLLGDGHGGFAAPQHNPVAHTRRIDLLVPGDIDRDGHPDLIGFDDLFDPTAGVVAFGDGTGGIAEDHMVGTGTKLGGDGTPARQVAITDLEGDGDDDVLFLAGSLGVLENAMNGRRQH